VVEIQRIQTIKEIQKENVKYQHPEEAQYVSICIYIKMERKRDVLFKH
tara:strand:+ start:128 stop:271 length:144 start_codon:yes stop_codon:yes gene_type:complete